MWKWCRHRLASTTYGCQAFISTMNMVIACGGTVTIVTDESRDPPLAVLPARVMHSTGALSRAG
jgi:hypothetical protein